MRSSYFQDSGMVAGVRPKELYSREDGVLKNTGFGSQRKRRETSAGGLSKMVITVM